jgi:hypothetical protein
VGDHAADPDLAWHGDLDAGGVPDQRPSICRGAVAQDGTRTAGEDRGQVQRVVGEREVPDRVDASAERMQTPGGHPRRHRPAADSERAKLGDGHDPVLAPCELGHPRVRRASVHFLPIYVRN